MGNRWRITSFHPIHETDVSIWKGSVPVSTAPKCVEQTAVHAFRESFPARRGSYELPCVPFGPPRAKMLFVKLGPPGVDLMVGYVNRVRRSQMAMLELATSGHICPVVRVRVALDSQQLGKVEGGAFWWFLDPYVRNPKRGARWSYNAQKPPRL